MIADGVAYVGLGADVAGGQVPASDARTARLLSMVDEGLELPVDHGSTAASVGAGGIVSARDTVTGQERWRFVNSEPTARRRSRTASSTSRPIPAAHLRAGSSDRQHVLAVSVGRQQVHRRRQGMVFAATTSGSVYAMEATAPQWLRSHTPAPHGSVERAHADRRPSAALPEPFSVVAGTAATLDLDRPLGLAVGPFGDIYVTDRSDHVTRSLRMVVVRRWGGEGSKTGQFDFDAAGSGDNPRVRSRRTGRKGQRE